MAECSDCRRILPDSEKLYDGKCRICTRLPAWRSVGAASTPVIKPPKCPDCKERPRLWHRVYCKPCLTVRNRRYMRAWRARNRKGKAKVLPVLDYHHVGPQPARIERESMKKMPGVDIDRIHYKLGAITKRKKAA